MTTETKCVVRHSSQHTPCKNISKLHTTCEEMTLWWCIPTLQISHSTAKNRRDLPWAIGLATSQGQGSSLDVLNANLRTQGCLSERTPGKHTAELVSLQHGGRRPLSVSQVSYTGYGQDTRGCPRHQVGGLSTSKPTEAQGSLLLISEAWNPHHQDSY